MNRTPVLRALLGLLFLIILAVVLFSCARRLNQNAVQTPEATGPARTGGATQDYTATQALLTLEGNSRATSATILASAPATQTSTATAQTAAPTPTLPAASPNPITVEPPGGAGAATGLTAEASCGALGARVTFFWVPGGGSGTQQVDVSNFNNDFIYGTYRSSEALPAEASSYIWEGLGDGVQYYWRVRKQSDQTWTPSETALIETLFCGGDSISP